MALYCTKKTTVEAIQLSESNFDSVESFIGINANNRHYNNEHDYLSKRNPVGIYMKNRPENVLVRVGDYVVRISDSFYQYSKEIFEQTYELEESSSNE